MANSYLNKTFSGAPTNAKKGTISMWFKLSQNDSSSNNYYRLFVTGADGSNRTDLNIVKPDADVDSNDTAGKLLFSHLVGGNNYTWRTNRQLRDFSAYYHLVVAYDTTQASASDRVKIYINGAQETSLDNSPTIPQNTDLFFGNNSSAHHIGNSPHYSPRFFQGLMAHFAYVDGTALTPTSFGETDSTSGIWKFKSPSGVTWGTNGFHLKFENSGNLGLDSSGQSNNFTTNGNLKQSLDTPSNSQCTLNPNDVMRQSGGIYKPTFSNANTTMSADGNYNYQTFGSLSPETGKWYWEFKVDVANTTGHRLGVFFGTDKTHSGSYYYGTDAFYIHQNGQIYYNGSSTTYMASYTANDIISVAMDVTNGNIYMSKNGGASDSTWADGSGNNNQAFPGTSVNGKLSASWITGPATPFFDVYGTGNIQSINFGDGFFGTTAITSAGSNGNGSLFEYDVPTGYYALNTKNLNTYG